MRPIEIKIISAIQHLTNTARFIAYKKEKHEKIADMLDQADHVFNLLKEPNVNIERIQRVLYSILEDHPECSRSIFTLIDE